MSDAPVTPATYNEFVRLIETNDTSVVAELLMQYYTANDELEDLIDEWRSYGFTLDIEGTAKAEMIGRCADELEKVIEPDE